MQLTSTVGLLAALAATASAQAGTTVSVTVGKGGLVYNPSDIKAAVGTVVEFEFFPKNHSVTQSSFKDPCHPLDGGFFSSFVPTANAAGSGSTFAITVTDTKPIWIYCGQTTGMHCQAGMVAAINAPASGNTLAAFQALAKNATVSTSPPGGAVGGILKIAAGNSSSSASSAVAASSTVLSTKTVQTTVTTTIITSVTKDGSTYATTYPSTYATSYTTALAVSTVAAQTSPTGTTTSPAASNTGSGSTGSAAGLAVNGGMAGAVLIAALAVL